VAATDEPPLGQRLRHLRRMAHLTETELAHAVGLTADDIARIEAGASVSLLTVEGIAKACGLTSSSPSGPVRDRAARRRLVPHRRGHSNPYPQ
jgi:transcriptional regulator with XRE-family HTH domain